MTHDALTEPWYCVACGAPLRRATTMGDYRRLVQEWRSEMMAEGIYGESDRGVLLWHIARLGRRIIELETIEAIWRGVPVDQQEAARQHYDNH